MSVVVSITELVAIESLVLDLAKRQPYEVVGALVQPSTPARRVERLKRAAGRGLSSLWPLLDDQQRAELVARAVHAHGDRARKCLERKREEARRAQRSHWGFDPRTFGRFRT